MSRSIPPEVLCCCPVTQSFFLFAFHIAGGAAVIADVLNRSPTLLWLSAPNHSASGSGGFGRGLPVVPRGTWQLPVYASPFSGSGSLAVDFPLPRVQRLTLAPAPPSLCWRCLALVLVLSSSHLRCLTQAWFWSSCGGLERISFCSQCLVHTDIALCGVPPCLPSSSFCMLGSGPSWPSEGVRLFHSRVSWLHRAETP